MNARRQAPTWRLITVALTVLAARTLWLFALYQAGGGAPRHQVESSALAFVLIGAATAFFNRDRSVEAVVDRQRTGGRVAWLVLLYCAASCALYFPALNLGLLSDDYVLAARAMGGHFGAVSPWLFRPLPLLGWSLLLHVGGGPIVLHAVNLLGHGLVAFLTTRVAAAYVPRWLAMIAGLLVLTFPAHVEAVAWVSGVFDVTSTGLTLLALLAARQLTWPVMTRRVAVSGLALAALLCKETALVTPLLVLLDQWALGRLSRRVLADVATLVALIVAVGVLRFASVPPPVEEPLSRFMVQRWLFGTVGALVVPWHREVMSRWLLIPIVEAVVVLGVATGFLVSTVRSTELRASAGFAAWALLGTAPTLPFFFVSPELEGSRYLYLASVGYAVLVAVLISALPARGRAGAVAASVLLIGLGLVGVRLHLAPWREAARTRDSFLVGVRNDPRTRTCRTISIATPPDSVRGAFVFRNGVHEALVAEGTTVSGDAPPDCVLRWPPERRPD